MKFLPVFLALVLAGCGKPLPVPPPHASAPPQTTRAAGLTPEEFDLQNRVACSLKGLEAGTPEFEACLLVEAAT